MDDKNPDIISCESKHELAVDDEVLQDVKIRKTAKTDLGGKKTELSHTKSITADNQTRSFTVKMTLMDGQAAKKEKETTMSKKELKEFQNKWKLLWNPVLFDSDDDDD